MYTPEEVGRGWGWNTVGWPAVARRAGGCGSARRPSLRWCGLRHAAALPRADGVAPRLAWASGARGRPRCLSCAPSAARCWACGARGVHAPPPPTPLPSLPSVSACRAGPGRCQCAAHLQLLQEIQLPHHRHGGVVPQCGRDPPAGGVSSTLYKYGGGVAAGRCGLSGVMWDRERRCPTPSPLTCTGTHTCTSPSPPHPHPHPHPAATTSPSRRRCWRSWRRAPTRCPTSSGPAWFARLAGCSSSNPRGRQQQPTWQAAAAGRRQRDQPQRMHSPPATRLSASTHHGHKEVLLRPAPCPPPMPPPSPSPFPASLQGGCEDDHIRMDFFAKETFDAMHGADRCGARARARPRSGCRDVGHGRGDGGAGHARSPGGLLGRQHRRVPAHRTAPHHTAPHHTTPRHATPHHTTLQHSTPTPHHSGQRSIEGCPCCLPVPPRRMAVDKLQEGIDNFAGGVAGRGGVAETAVGNFAGCGAVVGLAVGPVRQALAKELPARWHACKPASVCIAIRGSGRLPGRLIVWWSSPRCRCRRASAPPACAADQLKLEELIAATLEKKE